MEYKPSYTDSLRADILPSYSDSLMHYGVLGMKWGVRRYQNKDGTYTAQGKKHRSNKFKLTENQRNLLRATNTVIIGAAATHLIVNSRTRQLAKEVIDENKDKTVDDILTETTSDSKTTYRDVGEAYAHEILSRDPLRSGGDADSLKRFMALPAKGQTSKDESAQSRLEDLKYDRDEAIDEYNAYLNRVVESNRTRTAKYDVRKRRMDTLEQRRQEARQRVREYEDYKNSLGQTPDKSSTKRHKVRDSAVKDTIEDLYEINDDIGRTATDYAKRIRGY